jgi:colanic acid/amylovoran biosynthesis glycosyltransferase
MRRVRQANRESASVRLVNPAEPRLGYLTDHYPATSHTFVQREVHALRQLGVEVHTFSTHRVGRQHLLSEEDREAFASTFAILPVSPLRLAAAHMRTLVAAWHAYIRTLVFAFALGRGLRARLWQLFYFCEAVLLAQECRTRGLTHVHAHFTRPAADTALLVCRLGWLMDPRAGWTWSFTAHGTDIYDTDSVALATKIRHATMVICVSDYGRARLERLVEDRERPKIRLVRCGIDLTRFPALERSRQISERLRVLTVGRLVEVKGQAVLLDAFARLVAEGIDGELTIVGDGPLRTALEALARGLGVARRVHFAGRVGQDEILHFYERADIFALASFSEGIPVVLMEAMATQLPVVATRITAIPELVEDGRHGLLVPPDRSDLLAAALTALARNPARRAEMGRAARAQIETGFELRGAAMRLREVMEEFGAIPRTGDGLGATVERAVVSF